MRRPQAHRPLPLPASLLSLLLLLLATTALTLTTADEPPLPERIYTQYVNQGYCVKLLHQTGWVGSPQDGLRGRIVLADDLSAVQKLAASPPDYAVSVLLPPALLRRETLRLLSSSPGLEVAGVMVLPPDTPPGSTVPIPPTGGYSPASPTPQLQPFIPSTPAIPSRPAQSSPFNRSYEWNPAGEDITHMQFRFAIVTVTDKEKEYLLELARDNEQDAAEGNFVAHAAEFRYNMYARKNSPHCLQERTCMPVGGQSVWGSLGNLTHNSTEQPIQPEDLRPILLVTTKMDSSGFFQQLSPGGDDSMASVALLVAALQTLANHTGVADLPMQILFAFFQGETFSHVGSRKFVDDLLHFQCEQFNMKDEADTGAACNRPYKNSLSFQDVHLSQIEKLVDVGMIGLNESVFLHRERDANTLTDEMIDTFEQVAANLSTPISIQMADADTPGIPPSPAQAFLEKKEDIAVLVMTDHAGPYANRYLHSQFDSSLNMLSNSIPGSAAIQHELLCSKATLLARTLWLEAGGEEESAALLHADCELINQIIHCMLEDYECELIRRLAPHAFSNSQVPGSRVLPHYTSVFQFLPERYIGGTPLFLHRLLNQFILNATDWHPPPSGVDPKKWPAPPVNLHFHDAVDPNLVFSHTDKRWHIRPTANDWLLWTESNWDNNVRWRSYRMVSQKTEATTFGVGMGLTVATALAVWAMQRYCNKRFKPLRS